MPGYHQDISLPAAFLENVFQKSNTFTFLLQILYLPFWIFFQKKNKFSTKKTLEEVLLFHHNPTASLPPFSILWKNRDFLWEKFFFPKKIFSFFRDYTFAVALR